MPRGPDYQYRYFKLICWEFLLSVSLLQAHLLGILPDLQGNFSRLHRLWLFPCGFVVSRRLPNWSYADSAQFLLLVNKHFFIELEELSSSVGPFQNVLIPQRVERRGENFYSPFETQLQPRASSSRSSLFPWSIFGRWLTHKTPAK